MFRQVTVPGWVMWTLTLQAVGFIALLCVIALAILGTLPRYGEQPFTSSQREYLDDLWPNGTYQTPSTFRYCQGSQFFYVDSRQQTWTHNELCAAGMPRR